LDFHITEQVHSFGCAITSFCHKHHSLTQDAGGKRKEREKKTHTKKEER